MQIRSIIGARVQGLTNFTLAWVEAQGLGFEVKVLLWVVFGLLGKHVAPSQTMTYLKRRMTSVRPRAIHPGFTMGCTCQLYLGYNYEPQTLNPTP